MIKVAVVEDDNSDYENLLNYLHVFESENDVTFECTHFTSGEDFLEDYLPVYDLILMDVRMSA